jgi:ADP-ribose pyrophosphatase YjhB (NUDIX family)
MPTIGTNVAVIRDGHVLLTRREDVAMWCLPGGGIESGESIRHRESLYLVERW